MNKKMLILLCIFLAIILIFVLWINSINNGDKVILPKKPQEVKSEDKAREPIFNTNIIEQNNINQGQEEGPIAI